MQTWLQLTGERGQLGAGGVDASERAIARVIVVGVVGVACVGRVVGRGLVDGVDFVCHFGGGGGFFPVYLRKYYGNRGMVGRRGRKKREREREREREKRKKDGFYRIGAGRHDI